MATSRTEMERKLRCNKVEGLSKDYQREAENMAVKYVLRYSVKESGYELSYELVKNRVENLMLDALEKNPSLTAKEFATQTKLAELFIDSKAILYLVELAGEGDSDAYFYYAYHFFSLSVCSYINHHAFYVSPLDKLELVSILFTQVHFALKGCAEKNVLFNFRTLYLMFQAAVFDLNGVVRFPFTLRRKEIEQYFRFRANVINRNLRIDDMEVLANLLSLPLEKVLSYWELYSCEAGGFLSTSLLLEDENLETIFGKVDEARFLDVEILEMRNRLFEDEVDRRIFDSLIGNGDGTFTRVEIETLGTSRYHINQVKEILRQNSTELKPIE